jgi:hypothetical protein
MEGFLNYMTKLVEQDYNTAVAAMVGAITAATSSVVITTTPLNWAAGAMFGIFRGGLVHATN